MRLFADLQGDLMWVHCAAQGRVKATLHLGLQKKKVHTQTEETTRREKEREGERRERREHVSD